MQSRCPISAIDLSIAQRHRKEKTKISHLLYNAQTEQVYQPYPRCPNSELAGDKPETSRRLYQTVASDQPCSCNFAAMQLLFSL